MSARSSAITSCATTSTPWAARRPRPIRTSAFRSIPSSVRGISQTNNWHSLRLGLEGSVEFDRRWKLTLDAAWIPYAVLFGADSHLLRIGSDFGNFTGPIPEDGKGWGYQFDATVSYRFNDGSASAPAAATGTSRPRATPISKVAWSGSTPSRRSCTGGPTISAASSRPISSSVLTRCSSTSA